jgi:hypothetical protein
MTQIRMLQLLIFVQAFMIAGCRHAPSIIPGDFHEAALPKPGSKEWSSLNYSNNEFEVNLVDKELKIKKVKEEAKMTKCELKILGGTLIGINRGEWGGQLTFLPVDTTTKAIQIKQGNIQCIASYKDKLYFLEGLAHGGYSGGAIFELTVTGDRFTYHRLVNFDDAPLTFTAYRDMFFVATNQNFYIVQNLKKKLIFKDVFWGGLYPNSMAILDEKNVFLGIRGGVVKLDLIDKTLKFYEQQQKQ